MSTDILTTYLEIAISFAFTVEIVNLYLLIRLKKWADSAGKSLINDVISSLNLKWGKDSSTAADIKQVVSQLSPQLGEALQAATAGGAGLNPETIIQGLLEGTLDWRSLIPVAINALKSPASSAQGAETPGSWH